MVLTACDTKQAAIITATSSPENTAATDNAQELEWRSDWKSKYDKVMADWQPAQQMESNGLNQNV
jgi:hypothetical protein